MEVKLTAEVVVRMIDKNDADALNTLCKPRTITLILVTSLLYLMQVTGVNCLSRSLILG